MVSLGKDSNGTRIKAWSRPKDSSHTNQLTQLRAIDCFTGKQSHSEVKQMTVHNAWPQLLYALGLADGSILLIRGDTGDVRQLQVCVVKAF